MCGVQRMCASITFEWRFKRSFCLSFRIVLRATANQHKPRPLLLWTSSDFRPKHPNNPPTNPSNNPLSNSSSNPSSKMIKFFEYQGAVYTLKDDDDQRLAYCTQVLTNTQNYNKPAYFLFHNDVSPRLKKEHPNRERGYINHLVSLEWGRLPVERQEYYRRKEKENRTREPSPDVRCQGRLKFRRTNGADDLIEYTEHQNWYLWISNF